MDYAVILNGRVIGTINYRINARNFLILPILFGQGARLPFDKDCICNLGQAKKLLLRNVEDVDERRLMIRTNNGFNNRTGAKLAYGCDPIYFENMTSRRIL